MHERGASIDAELAPGDTLDSYRVERPLGRGGMGAVYLAHDTTLHRQVALKVLSSSEDTETARARLLREARNAAALNHPNICTIYEVGESAGRAFIAMEYVDGQSLSDRLRNGPLSLEEVLRYGSEAADALTYAHDHRVVHRDFKAANALVSTAGRLKIVDFGLARRGDEMMSGATTMPTVVPAGAVAGTPYAMAPEQVRGDTTDARTDIWAFGVLLYEMVTGAKPFDGATVPELYSSILRDAPKPWAAGVAVQIRPVIERCLDKDPERRYQKARDVGDALGAIRTGLVPPWTAWRYQLTRRPGLAMLATILGVAALLVGVNVGGVRDRLAGRVPAAAAIKLAVLPFENLTGDSEQEYLSDGLTDEMITQLGGLSPQRLRVIARTSSMRYKKRDVPIDQIGRELGVDYLLEGSARREGTRVRISATLIQAHDQTQRWTNSFERELSGILALQADVARGVAASLALELLPTEDTRLRVVTDRLVNPEAYDAYLKGRFHWQKLTPKELDVAMSYFQLAVEKDPRYALAYTGISTVWSLRCNQGLTRCGDVLPKSKEAALKAVDLDPTSPEARAQMAATTFYVDWNWQAAEKELKRAIDLSPSYPEAHIWYSEYLIYVASRSEDGIAEMRRALELDPQNSLYQAFVGQILLAGRHDAEAIAYLQQVLQNDPNMNLARGQLLAAFEVTQRYDEALSLRRRQAAASGDREVAEALDRGYSAGGYRAAMRLLAEGAVRRSQRVYVPPTNVAGLYARAGENELAMDWLERAYEEHSMQMVRIRGNRTWDVLRKQPRFQALLRRMNLPS
jgi:eukaryotic-like serine/threonine-protein kinase